ncbi:MAG: hypothetical protein ACTSRR_10175 [Candidatus Heimdallarchaeaceae archaeon]
MYSYSLREKIRIYLPTHSFFQLISKECEERIENGEYEKILFSMPNAQSSQELKEIQDPIELLVVFALTAKKIIEENKMDKQTILFMLSKLYPSIFNEIVENESGLFSQEIISEIIEFSDKFKRYQLYFTPRSDTNLTIILKIQFYINVYLYIALSLHEQRFPFGSTYYEFITLQLREFYSILKPISKKSESEVRRLSSALLNFIPFNSIIYLFDHYPEQATELIFILTHALNFKPTETEKEILTDYINSMIFIASEDKDKLLATIE